MNTSIVNLNYHLDTIDFEFDDIEEFLSGEVKTLEKRFQMFNRKWYVSNRDRFEVGINCHKGNSR